MATLDDVVVPQCTFPDEIVEDILIRAWLSPNWPSPKERWLWYFKILGISRQWNRIIRSVVFNYRMLQTLADFQLYTHLHPPTLEDGTARRFKYLKFPSNDLAMTFLYAFDLEQYLDQCIELDIAPMSDGNLWTLLKILSCADVETPLRSFAFAFQNYAAHSFPTKDIWGDLVTRAPKLSAITTLSITCTSTKQTGWIYRDIMDFRSSLLPFPNLKHLRTNVPISLNLVAEYLQTLVTLTLDVPPVYLKTFHATSLLNWGLISALKNGAFRPRKVVIESGPLKPLGWDQLRKVCETQGVLLVYEVKYSGEVVPPRVIPPVEESTRNLEGAL